MVFYPSFRKLFKILGDGPCAQSKTSDYLLPDFPLIRNVFCSFWFVFHLLLLLHFAASARIIKETVHVPGTNRQMSTESWTARLVTSLILQCWVVVVFLYKGTSSFSSHSWTITQLDFHLCHLPSCPPPPPVLHQQKFRFNLVEEFFTSPPAQTFVSFS